MSMTESEKQQARTLIEWLDRFQPDAYMCDVAQNAYDDLSQTDYDFFMEHGGQYTTYIEEAIADLEKEIAAPTFTVEESPRQTDAPLAESAREREEVIQIAPYRLAMYIKTPKGQGKVVGIIEEHKPGSATFMRRLDIRIVEGKHVHQHITVCQYFACTDTVWED